jgi:hypothetical protein
VAADNGIDVTGVDIIRTSRHAGHAGAQQR